MMHRTFMALIVAAALVITGLTAAPARADNEDVAKIIAGAAALAILGAAISDRRKDLALTRHRYHGHDRFAYRRHLPNTCHVRLRTANGLLRGFGRRCLRHNYPGFRSLPRACAFRTYSGQRHHGHIRGDHHGHGQRGRVVYDGRCLYRHGYAMAQGR